MSAVVGLDEQPLHTDGAYMPIPPRILLFECLHSGEVACGTKLLIPENGNLLGDRTGILQHPAWVTSQRIDRRAYCSVVEKRRHKLRVRFDPICMSNTHFEDAPRAALRQLQRKALSTTVVLKAGEWLAIDNWKVLHGRSAGANLSPSRRIRRTYYEGGYELGE
jgi:hypothetical protein